MQVFRGKDLLLSNIEVLHLLKDYSAGTSMSQINTHILHNKTISTKHNRDGASEGDKDSTSRDDVTGLISGVRRYLESVSDSRMDLEIVPQLLQQLKRYKLTKNEKLQIINNRPSTLAQLTCLIEESEERFSDDTMNHLLNVLHEHLPPTDNNHKDDDHKIL